MLKALIALFAFALLSLQTGAQAKTTPRPQIMVVGVAHFVAKADLHNAQWSQDARSPAMQAQIRAVTARLAAFRPTKVFIEGLVTESKYAKNYKAYLAGKYALSSNERDQLGFRLAAMAHNPTIYPIDVKAGFPFDYDAVQKSAKRWGQTGILTAADDHERSFIARSNSLEKQGRVLDLLRYLNTPQALSDNRLVVHVREPNRQRRERLRRSRFGVVLVRAESAHAGQHHACSFAGRSRGGHRWPGACSDAASANPHVAVSPRRGPGAVPESVRKTVSAASLAYASFQ